MNTADPDEVKVYPCPLPACHWATVSEPPGPAEHPGALADLFGQGVFAAHATNERLRRKEAELAGHLATHSVQEFAIALAEANKRLGTIMVTAERWAAYGEGAQLSERDMAFTEAGLYLLEMRATP